MRISSEINELGSHCRLPRRRHLAIAFNIFCNHICADSFPTLLGEAATE